MGKSPRQGPANPPLKVMSCGLDEPGKVMASELLFAIKLMGRVYPAIFPGCWHRVFVRIQISQTVARVRGRSDNTVMYRRTCLGISLTLKAHTRKWRRRRPSKEKKNCLMRPRLSCSFSFSTFIIFIFFSWHTCFINGSCDSPYILCPLEIRTLSSTLALHFPALGERSSKSVQRTLAFLSQDELKSNCHGLS